MRTIEARSQRRLATNVELTEDDQPLGVVEMGSFGRGSRYVTGSWTAEFERRSLVSWDLVGTIQGDIGIRGRPFSTRSEISWTGGSATLVPKPFKGRLVLQRGGVEVGSLRMNGVGRMDATIQLEDDVPDAVAAVLVFLMVRRRRAAAAGG